MALNSQIACAALAIDSGNYCSGEQGSIVKCIYKIVQSSLYS